MLNTKVALPLITFLCLSGFSLVVCAEDASSATPQPSHASRILVLLPERIDVEWYWYYYTTESQHIVQAAVEKELIRAGYDVVDVSAAAVFGEAGDVEGLAAAGTALEFGRAVGATYVIAGQAEAVRASHDVAYGVDVYRSSADMTAKILRTSDGKVLAVEDASALEGGQSQRVAGREALKNLGKDIARKLRLRLAKVLESEELETD